MTLIIADRIKETTTTTGTGALTLAGAITGYRTFASVMTSPSDTCYYGLHGVDADGVPTGQWEVGLGTYSAANTLTRTTVLSSSNAGAAVNLSAGTKQIWLDAPATVLQNLVGSGQIQFPATQNASAGANVLDDYEEGTWTPTIAGSTTAGANTYNIQAGRYIKIGGLVFCTFNVSMTAKDGAMAGNALIAGLPFTSLSTGISGAAIGVFFNLATAFYGLSGFVDGSATTINLYGVSNTVGATSQSALTAADISATTNIVGSVAYAVA